MTRLALRHLTAADIPFADSLRAIVGWNQTITDWQRFIDLSPKGCLVAECEGRPVATATTVTYGEDLAWIGMVLVHPDFRRRGIARVLLEHCMEILQLRRIRSIKLDATPEGREVYLRLGFRDEFRLTRYAREPGNSVANETGGIRDARGDDLKEIVALDEAAIGARREGLIRRLVAESRRGIVIESGARKISGFGLLRSGALASYLGPVVASDPRQAVAIVSALISGNQTICWDIPNHHETVASWAKTQGFSAVRTLTRMYFGENVQQAAPGSYFAIAGPDLG